MGQEKKITATKTTKEAEVDLIKRNFMYIDLVLPDFFCLYHTTGGK